MKTVGFFEDYKGMAVLLRGEGVSPLKLSGRVWAIRYDIRYNYLLSPNWDDEMVRNVVLSCKKLRHKWTDGWICDYCGKRKADLEEFKYENPKWK